MVTTPILPVSGFEPKTKKEYFDKLGHLMDIAKDTLETKRLLKLPLKGL